MKQLNHSTQAVHELSPSNNNPTKLNNEEYQLTTKERNHAIKQLYTSGNHTTEYIAKLYSVSPRAIQRIAKKGGFIRTQAESNRLVAPLKKYHTVPIELRVKRKSLSLKQRYSAITAHPYCGVCGKRPDDGVRLEVDHIDENPSNNKPSNLQVLCTQCNTGKSHIHRFGSI